MDSPKEGMMDIYEILRQEHAALLAMIKRLVALSHNDADPSVRRELAHKLRQELHLHHCTEEAILYHTLRNLSAGTVWAAERADEHARMDAVLELLERVQIPTTKWREATLELATAFKAHVADEESRVFQFAQRLLRPSTAAHLGELYWGHKREVVLERAARLDPSVFKSVESKGLRVGV